jgi:peptidoglycan hydrolase-like protein with peptidoglycan-binding domain
VAVIRQRRRERSAASPHAVSGRARDDVLLSRCEYKSATTRKSLTVHHVQRRLIELGYTGVRADKDGWYADATRAAVARFQESLAAGEATGLMDAATFVALFEGDVNVTVRVD